MIYTLIYTLSHDMHSHDTCYYFSLWFIVYAHKQNTLEYAMFIFVCMVDKVTYLGPKDLNCMFHTVCVKSSKVIYQFGKIIIWDLK